MNCSDLRVTFNFLKRAAFYDLPLPNCTFAVRPLKDAWGTYSDACQIEIDSSIKTGDKLLRVMAHEMVHAALHEAGSFDKSPHGPKFRLISKTICQRMGWRNLGV